MMVTNACGGRYSLEGVMRVSISRIEHHPFVRSARRCELSMEDLERWIFCAGRESRIFPYIIKGILQWSEDKAIRHVLQANLRDELGDGISTEAHFRHYLRLLHELGIEVERFDRYESKYGLTAALDTAVAIANGHNELLALGYMLVNEGMTPIIYRAVECGLTNIRGKLNTLFFDLHVTMDEEHVSELLTLVKRLDISRASEVIVGIEKGEQAMALLLDEALGRYEVAK